MFDGGAGAPSRPRSGSSSARNAPMVIAKTTTAQATTSHDIRVSISPNGPNSATLRATALGITRCEPYCTPTVPSAANSELGNSGNQPIRPSRNRYWVHHQTSIEATSSITTPSQGPTPNPS